MENNAIQTESLSVRENQQKADRISIKFSLKTAIIIAAIIAIGALVYVYKGLFIAATVDGNPISRFAVIKELEKASGKNLLDSLIVQKLVQNEAKAKKIIVSDGEVNEEIKKIEDRISAQGGALGAALAAQGINMEDLKKEIIFQKEIEKLVADKINVTDEEAAKYIKDNSIPILKGQEATTTADIKDKIRNQKLNAEAGTLLAALKSRAKIRYFVNY